MYVRCPMSPRAYTLCKYAVYAAGCDIKWHKMYSVLVRVVPCLVDTLREYKSGVTSPVFSMAVEILDTVYMIITHTRTHARTHTHNRSKFNNV